MLGVSGLTPVLFALTTSSLVRVEGSSRCPTPEQVDRELARLLPAGTLDEEQDQASIAADARGISLSLRRSDGTLVGEKTFEANASCAELAEAIAIVIAIWEWPLRPGLVPPPDLPRERPSEVATPESPVPAPKQSAWRFEQGAGFRGVLPGFVPGAMLEGVARNRAGGWGGRLQFSAAWWNESSFGSGTAQWTRLSAGIGFIHGWSSSKFFFDLHEDLLAAALIGEGEGYEQTQTQTVFDPGLGVGARGGAAIGSYFRLWLDGSVVFWPLDHQLQVVGVDQTLNVSSFETSISVGVTLLTSR